MDYGVSALLVVTADCSVSVLLSLATLCKILAPIILGNYLKKVLEECICPISLPLLRDCLLKICG